MDFPLLAYVHTVIETLYFQFSTQLDMRDFSMREVRERGAFFNSFSLSLFYEMLHSDGLSCS